jgi:hypothetical protein
MTIVPHSPYFSLFTQVKIKWKGRHVDTDTHHLDEAESQAVLNTLTEHDFQGGFKKLQKFWERFICTEGDYFKCDGGQ